MHWHIDYNHAALTHGRFALVGRRGVSQCATCAPRGDGGKSQEGARCKPWQPEPEPEPDLVQATPGGVHIPHAQVEEVLRGLQARVGLGTVCRRRPRRVLGGSNGG